MKRDFDDKYKDSLPEDDLVSIEDMTDEEFKEFNQSCEHLKSFYECLDD